MNRTLFTCVVFATFFFVAALAKAVPIQYSVDWVPGAFTPNDDVLGLTGAKIDFEAQLDPATVTPTDSYTETDWPIVAQVTVTGSSYADGTYMEDSSVQLYDDVTTFYSLQFNSPVDIVWFEGPEFEIKVPFSNDEIPIDIPYNIFLALPASFSTPAPDGTIFPYAFEYSDLTLLPSDYEPSIFYDDSGGESGGTTPSESFGYLLSASADFVPEPGTAGLLALGGLIAIRRRRR